MPNGMQTQPGATEQPVADNDGPIGKKKFENLSEKEKAALLKAEEIFRKGIVTVRDMIAPSAMKVEADHLRLNNKFVRTIFVFTYPRYVSTGWFAPIINLNEEMDISMYITPVDSQKILKTLKTKVGQIESTMSSKAEKGEVRDPMLQTALHDVEGLRDKLIQGTERFFHFAL
jgi:hypothetical protein